MKEFIPSYYEGYAALELDAGFFRPDSILARDFSVLIAAMQFDENKSAKPLKWLDLMAGCGVRSLRWGLEAVVDTPNQKNSLQDLELWINDADLDRCDLIKRNMKPLLKKEISLHFKNDLAEVLLSRAYLNRSFFDLIDLDCFGSPNYLLYPVLKVMAFDGILMLSSTDARSTTGHDRLGAIRSLAAAARTHPASWEIALRLQLGAVARQAWLLGRGLEPLVCFSDGRTFRIFVRLKRHLCHEEEQQLGFIARCKMCGAQESQTLYKVKEWKECLCGLGLSRLLISGPLWIGPLQSPKVLEKLKKISIQLEVPIIDRTRELIDRLHSDIGLPIFSWSTHELASRLALDEPPPLDLMIKFLHADGYQAFRSCVVPGHFRTEASIGELLRICKNKFFKGFK